MRIIWWLPIPAWRDWANILLDYGFYANTHYDQNLLLTDLSTKKFTTESINCDLLILDRETFPIPDGYVEYDSNNDVWKIYYWTAFKDLINIAKQKGIMIANTGGMFSWYACVRKGLIPSDVTQVQMEFPWGWETINKQSTWDGQVDQIQDMWNIGDKGQRCLYYYIKGTDPHCSIQGFTNGLYASLPFIGLVYSVPRAVKADPNLSPNAIEIGFTPLNIKQHSDGYYYAVTAVNFNCPVMIYGVKFSSQYDAINVIVDLMTGLTSVDNYSVIRKIPIEILDNLNQPINFTWAWTGPTHLKLLGKIKNSSKNKITLSIKDLVEKDYFIKIPKELVRYADKIEVVEETSRKTLSAWSQVDDNTWVSDFSSSPEDFSCDFESGVVKVVQAKLNIIDTTGNPTIRMRAYTDDSNYFEEVRTLWNWHCYKKGEFWLVWAICATPQSRFGAVEGNPDVSNIKKIEIYISDTNKVTLDTSTAPIKVEYLEIPQTRYCVIDKGGYFIVTWWDSDGNFSINPESERNFVLVINPTPFLDVIEEIAYALPWDQTIQQIYNDTLNVSFYYEVVEQYEKLMEYIKRKGLDLSKKIKDLNLMKL